MTPTSSLTRHSAGSKRRSRPGNSRLRAFPRLWRSRDDVEKDKSVPPHAPAAWCRVGDGCDRCVVPLRIGRRLGGISRRARPCHAPARHLHDLRGRGSAGRADVLVSRATGEWRIIASQPQQYPPCPHPQRLGGCRGIFPIYLLVWDWYQAFAVVGGLAVLGSVMCFVALSVGDKVRPRTADPDDAIEHR